MADAERARLVERDDVPVMFKRVADEQTAISRGWAEVEEAVGSLRGRKFYGVFDGGEYRVCVQLREEDEPAGLGLETGTLPGGRYAQVRLQGEPPAVYERIAPAFESWRGGLTVIRVVRARVLPAPRCDRPPPTCQVGDHASHSTARATIDRVQWPSSIGTRAVDVSAFAARKGEVTEGSTAFSHRMRTWHRARSRRYRRNRIVAHAADGSGWP
jgi:hypothetical protein